MIVGGVAVVLQAMPRFTKDLDICYSPTEENLEALGGVLVELKARLRGISEEVPFVPDVGRSDSYLTRCVAWQETRQGMWSVRRTLSCG